MALVLPFKAVRPLAKYASEVAALPYDVMTREEGQKAVAGGRSALCMWKNLKSTCRTARGRMTL